MARALRIAHLPSVGAPLRPPLARATNSRDGADSRVGAASTLAHQSIRVSRGWRDHHGGGLVIFLVMTSPHGGSFLPTSSRGPSLRLSVSREWRCSLPSPTRFAGPSSRTLCECNGGHVGPRGNVHQGHDRHISALGFGGAFTRWRCTPDRRGCHWIAPVNRQRCTLDRSASLRPSLSSWTRSSASRWASGSTANVCTRCTEPHHRCHGFRSHVRRDRRPYANGAGINER